MEDFNVDLEARDGGAIVHLVGDASCIQAEFMRDALKPVLDQGPKWVVLDLTKPEFGVPVVRVVIPGLEGIDSSPRYLRGPRARAVLNGGAA